MRTRLLLFTDIHANLPALEGIQAAVRAESPDMVFHLGDAVDMGPFPAEVLDVLASQTTWVCLQGNHEQFMFGWERDGTDELELQHRAWTRSQLTPAHFHLMRGWPLHHVLKAEGLRVCLQHYALVPTDGETLTFRPYFEPTATAMEDAFSGGSFDLVFYGHLHRPVFTQSPGTRYYALMSSGTGRTAEAAYTVVDLANGQAQVCHKTIQYDDQVLFTAMEHRQVPAREFLYQAFYGGRFTPANENPAE